MSVALSHRGKTAPTRHSGWAQPAGRKFKGKDSTSTLHITPTGGLQSGTLTDKSHLVKRLQVRPAKQRKTFTFKVGSFKGRREYLLREELVKTRRILSVTIQLALGVSILSVAILLLLNHFKIIETVKPFVVMSGSMNPAVKLGSVVIVKPESSYRPGDIITYAPDGNKENPITHRIVFRKFPEGPAGEPVYITAGDANDDFDSVQVGPANVIGRVQFSIPYLGYLVSLAKQPYGFILFVIVPATIVIYERPKTPQGRTRGKYQRPVCRSIFSVGKKNLFPKQGRLFR